MQGHRLLNVLIGGLAIGLLQGLVVAVIRR